MAHGMLELEVEGLMGLMGPVMVRRSRHCRDRSVGRAAWVGRVDVVAGISVVLVRRRSPRSMLGTPQVNDRFTGLVAPPTGNQGRRAVV